MKPRLQCIHLLLHRVQVIHDDTLETFFFLYLFLWTVSLQPPPPPFSLSSARVRLSHRRAFSRNSDTQLKSSLKAALPMTCTCTNSEIQKF